VTSGPISSGVYVYSTHCNSLSHCSLLPTRIYYNMFTRIYYYIEGIDTSFFHGIVQNFPFSFGAFAGAFYVSRFTLWGYWKKNQSLWNLPPPFGCPADEGPIWRLMDVLHSAEVGKLSLASRCMDVAGSSQT